MIKARFMGLRNIEVVEEPMPVVPNGYVLVKVAYAGVCGSDMHAFTGEHPFVKPPIVLGHECAGVVANDANSRFAKGEKVVLEPNVVCGECHSCRTGRYNICSKLEVIGCVGVDGGYAEYMAVPESRMARVPLKWDLKRAVMVEPAAVCVHAVKQGQVRHGDKVVVIGAGTIGLLAAQSALAAGASEVIISDPIDSRLGLAKQLGITHAVNPAKASLRDCVWDKFPAGADVIFDGVASANTINQCIETARKGTKIILLGVPAGTVNVNLAFVQDRELELVGTLMYTREDYNRAIEWIDSGVLKVDELITDVMPLTRAKEALEKAISKTGNSIKILLDCTVQE